MSKLDGIFCSGSQKAKIKVSAKLDFHLEDLGVEVRGNLLPSSSGCW